LGVDLPPQRADRRGDDRDRLPAAARIAWTERRRVDWAGLVTFSGALFLLVLGLLRGNDEGWASLPIVAELAGAAALLAAFLVIERRVAEPMLPLELFRRPAFVGVQLAMFAVSSTMFALYLYVTLYLQGYLGHSPLEAGIRFLPIMTMAFVVSSLTGPLVARVHTSVLLGTGLALTGAGLLLMAGIDTGSSWTTLLAGWLLGGAGVGLLNPVIADAAVSVVPKERSGMAAGINNTFRQVGVAVGVAAWGAVFLSRGADRASELVAGTSAAGDERSSQLVEAVSAGQLGPAVAALPPSARESAADAAREGFVAGLNSVLTMGGALAIAGAAIALWLVRREPSGHRRHETTGPSCEGGVSPPGSHTVTPVVLVHGNWHGSWCWSLVCEDLAARGISSVAVDLEGHGLRGPSPKSRWSRPFDAWSYAAEPSPAASVTASSAAQNLTEQLRRIGRGRPCVVVAHSMGGVVATAAAEQAPELVAAVVYIAAFVPVRGLPAASYFGLPENEGSMVALGLAADPAAVDAFRYDTGNPASREVIRETFYNDVDPAMADAATALITSDAPAGIAGEAITVTPARFGTVPHAFVVCARDNAVRPALQRLAVAEVDAVSAHPTEVVELDASHAPFLSMPARLGEIIENVAWRSRIRRSPERFLR
jgi:pimeloyl-ACP methyl ester carboxylesterase